MKLTNGFEEMKIPNDEKFKSLLLQMGHHQVVLRLLTQFRVQKSFFLPSREIFREFSSQYFPSCAFCFVLLHVRNLKSPFVSLRPVLSSES